MGQHKFIDDLKAALGQGREDLIFPCVEDLVINGFQPSRMSLTDSVPNRQDVTQYLAAWCKSAGLDENTCREWLTGYALAILSSISKSSPSDIRHSTKSNVKYIYRYDISFRCRREQNEFGARCSHSCPVYVEMGREPAKPEIHAVDELTGPRHPLREEQEVLPPPKVKEVYREQFESAMQMVFREVEKGTKRAEIVGILNAHGMKTRTGRKWTSSILRSEIIKCEETHRNDSNPSAAGKKTGPQ